MKFHENLSNGNGVVPHRLTVGQKLIAIFAPLRTRLTITVGFTTSYQLTFLDANFRQSVSKHRAVKSCAQVGKGLSELSVSRSFCFIFRYPEELIGVHKEAKNLALLGPNAGPPINMQSLHWTNLQRAAAARTQLPNHFVHPYAVPLTCYRAFLLNLSKKIP
jgi:hypothetical protein